VHSKVCLANPDRLETKAHQEIKAQPEKKVIKDRLEDHLLDRQEERKDDHQGQVDREEQ